MTGWHVEIHLKIPLADDAQETTEHHEPQAPTDRQAIWACVPLVSINGDSYRMRAHRGAIQSLRPAITGGEFP